MGPQFIVYGLVDPRTGCVRYIGKSCGGMKRPASQGINQSQISRINTGTAHALVMS